MEIEGLLQQVGHHCKSHGKQLTARRKLVLHALLHADKALSAYELVDYCKSEFEESIQAMSVYRSLEFLEQENLAHKLKESNKYIACSHIECTHEHGMPQFFICSSCDKVSEQMIDPSLIASLQAHARQQGFTLQQSQLEINGICDDCK